MKEINTKNYNLKRNIQLAFRRHLAGVSIKSKYKDVFPHSAREYIQHFEAIRQGYINKPHEYDHIIPVCFFDLTNINELRLAYSKFNISITSRAKNKIKGVNVDTQTILRYFEYMDLITQRRDSKTLNILIEKAKSIQSENYLNKIIWPQTSLAV